MDKIVQAGAFFSLIFIFGLVFLCVPDSRTKYTTVRVEVELFFVVRTPTNMSAPVSMRETAFDTFDIVKKVDFALHGLETEEFYPMKRVSVGRNKQYYPRSFILTYETSRVLFLQT